MNKCAFVVPLHPKHYQYGYYIFDHLLNKTVDLYFVFTDTRDKDIFLSNLDKIHSDKLKYLILNEFADIRIVERTNSFVSIKKLFALSVLKDKYDYISCIDSEIRFLNDTDINYYTIMKNIVDSEIICGGKLPSDTCDRQIVINGLTRLTEQKYHSELQVLSDNFRVYTWWCNLPVYYCKIAEEFLHWINFTSTTLDRFSWDVFDDMTYNFFCMLFHGYTFKLIEGCFHSLEFSDSAVVEHVNNTMCKLYWVNNKAYSKNKDYYKNNNFHIVFHLDRWENIKPTLKNNRYED